MAAVVPVFVSAALSQISGVGVATAFFLASLLGFEPHHAPWYLDPLLIAILFATIGAALFSSHLERRRLAAETVVGIGYLISAAAVILAPNHARMEHQKNAPRTVTRLKRPNDMRAMPAGIEMKCRTTGMKRQTNTVSEPRVARRWG